MELYQKTLVVMSAVLLLGSAMAMGPGLGNENANETAGEGLATASSSMSTPTLKGESCYTGKSAFEPSLGITSDGSIFMEAAEVVTKGVLLIDEIQRVVKGSGACSGWTDVTDELTVGGFQQTIPPQSNDPVVTVDPGTDRVFNLDMQGLSCNWLSYSDDLGATWTWNPVACGQPPVLDHPTLFTGPPRLSEDQTALSLTGYPNVVYMCVNRVADSACARSLDGGQTFGPFYPLVYGGNCIGAGLHHFGISDSTGRLFLGQVDACAGVPTVAISENDGLSWTVEYITSGPGHDAFGHDVDIAIDANDNVYAAWIDLDDRRPRMAVSTNNGDTWSAPFDPAPSRLKTTSFLSLAAGDEGRVVLSYFGTNGTHVGGEVASGEPWGALLTTSTDLIDSTGSVATSPTFDSVNVNASADPVARGPCNGNNRCAPPQFGGSPGDFSDVEIDPDGRPWAAFVDVCNGSCKTGTTKSGQLAFAGTLETGPKLRGASGALPTLPP